MAAMDTLTAPGAARTSRASHLRLPLRLPLDLSRAVWLIAIAAYAVELALSGRYGYQRDELYFLAAGQHLAAGYVDQPALTPLLARLFALATGNSVVGLHALTALGLPLMVLLTASMARMLGASRGGQAVAALATACCGEYLGAFHLLTTTPVDFVFWTVTLWLMVRLLTSRDPRWWLPIGVVAGVALSAKWNTGFLLAGLALGLAATYRSSRPLLRSRYLLIAVAVAAVLGSPDIVWQATHGWPNLGVFARLQQDAWHNRIVYWPSQALYTSIALAPLWVLGLRWTLRDARLRPAGIAAVFVIVIQFVLGGKPYYPGGIYVLLFAAGSVGLSLARARAIVYAVAGAIAVLLSLPVLPAAVLARVPLQDINSDLGEQIAWPREVALVARVYAALPDTERPVAAVLAGNYGEAGAIDRYGPSLGLPQAYSGHNTFWWWGPPPPRDTVVVAIGVDLGLLRADFRTVRLAAVFTNGLGVSDQEQGTPVYVAAGLRTSWAAAWPAFRHYD